MIAIINFACRRISSKELFTCSFNITGTDYLLLVSLLRSGRERNIVELSSKLKKERSTIQKSMNRLMKKGLVRRRQMNLDNGGYMFYYSPIEKEEIKSCMLKVINEWFEGVSKNIESL